MTRYLSIEDKEGGRLLLAFRRPIARSDAPGVLAEFRALLDEFKEALDSSGAKEIELDLGGMMRYDHVGIAVLRQMALLCRENDRALEWRNAGPGLDEALAALDDAAPDDENVGRKSQPIPLQVGARTVGIVSDAKAILSFVGELTQALYLAVRRPGFVRWSDVLFYMDRTGSDAVPIVAMICFLMGLILGFQSAVQLHQFGADIFIVDFVGLTICVELGPLMVAMICTGRAGSAFAAEIGTMKVSEEVDALVTMGLDPCRFLTLPKVLALVAAMPLLTVFGDLTGIAGGFVVGMAKLDIPFVAYFARTARVISPWHMAQGLIKSVVFALLVGAVGCLRGLRTEGGAQGVGGATTSAVVTGIFLIVLADTALTMVFNVLG